MLTTGQYGQLPLAAADGAQQRHRGCAALLIPQRLGLFLRQGCLKVDSGAVFGELNAAQPQHSFDVVRQRAQTPSN